MINLSDKLIKKLVWLGVGLIVLCSLFIICVDIVNVEGYEVGVVHKWSSGVQDEPLLDGLHFVWFGNCHKINVGTQKVSFAPQKKVDTEGEDTADNEFDIIEVACGNEGGQKAGVILTVVYHLDKKKAVQLYRDGLSKDYRYKIMKRTIIDVVNQEVRPKEALEIYSGVGFNELKTKIGDGIKTHEVLVSRGIEIENATLYDIKLDPKYEAEIQLKQLAKQKLLRATEEKLAAVEEAAAEAAKQQVMVETRRAEAEAKKIEVELAAEALKIEVELAAEAAKVKVVMQAEAEMEEAEMIGKGLKLKLTAEAEGQEALGLAEAKVAEAKKLAEYGGEEGKLRAAVELAKAQAEKLKGILSDVKIIPEKAFIAIMAEGTKVPIALTDQGIGAVAAAVEAPKK